MKPRICLVVSSPFTLNAFLGRHLEALNVHFQVTMIANLEDEAIRPMVPEGTVLRSVRIKRQVSLAHDLAALWTLWRLFRDTRFECVHSVSPKAGLLAMVAARAAGVTWRLHTFTGQVWATRHGAARLLLKSLDRVLAACATRVFADSASQCEFLVRQGVVRVGKVAVLGAGSFSGVDTARFVPDPAARAKVRSELGIPHDAPLLLYVGRMKREKGIADLLEAFGRLRACFPALHLLLVGPDEDRMFKGSVPAVQVHLLGYTKQPERYMAAADLLCLPSYREGFGSVIIEAAACGVPAVASRIYGLTDAIVEGETGLLHAPGDRTALHDALVRMLSQVDARLAMGSAARARALRDFDADAITGAWVDFYLRNVHVKA